MGRVGSGDFGWADINKFDNPILSQTYKTHNTKSWRMQLKNAK